MGECRKYGPERRVEVCDTCCVDSDRAYTYNPLTIQWECLKNNCREGYEKWTDGWPLECRKYGGFEHHEECDRCCDAGYTRDLIPSGKQCYSNDYKCKEGWYKWEGTWTECRNYAKAKYKDIFGWPACGDEGRRLRQNKTDTPQNHIATPVSTLHKISKEGDFIDPEDISLDILLGAGHSGRVYRGRYRKVIGDVAIKVGPRDPNNEHIIWGMAGQRINSSRITHVHGVGHGVLIDADGDDSRPMVRRNRKEGGTPGRTCDFVVEELLPGGTLDELFKRNAASSSSGASGAWPWSERLRVVVDVAEGMAQLHAAGYVHRDLNPQQN